MSYGRKTSYGCETSRPCCIQDLLPQDLLPHVLGKFAILYPYRKQTAPQIYCFVSSNKNESPLVL